MPSHELDAKVERCVAAILAREGGDKVSAIRKCKAAILKAHGKR